MKPRKIPMNMPIIMDLPEETFGNPVFLDSKGLQHRDLRSNFDLTLPSFVPVVPRNLPESAYQDIDNVRGWEVEPQVSDSMLRKELLQKGLNLEFDIDELLANHIKHTHPTLKPWDHQVTDAYLLTQSTNMLLTHEVRVGKTPTSILGAYNHPFVNKVLVICPKIVVYDAWVKGFKQWTDWSVCTYLSETTKKAKEERDANFVKWQNGEINVLVINIDFFKLNKDLFINNENKEDLKIIDEAHFLSKRNQSPRQPLTSANSKAVLEYQLNSTSFTWLLTGTPATRYEYDILSLFYILSPAGRIERHSVANYYHRKPKAPKARGKFIKDNYQEFFDKFLRITTLPSVSNGWQFEVAQTNDYQTAMNELNSLHRLHRNQVDIPGWGDPEQFNVYEDIEIQNTSKQEKIYKNIAKNIDELFIDFENPLVRDIFLRQIAVDHRLIKKNIIEGVDKLLTHEDKEYVENTLEEFFGITEMEGAREKIIEQVNDQYGFNVKGAKAEWMLNYIEGNKEQIHGNGFSDDVNTRGVSEDQFRTAQLKGRQPIIFFSFFTSFLKLMKTDIEEQFPEMRVEMINGEIVGEKRQEIIDAFQNGEVDILLANIAATKEGVTLNRGDEAIFLDRMWSTEIMEQVKARIHNPSKPYTKVEKFLMTKDSIDFKMKEYVDVKSANVEYVNKKIVNDVHGVKEDLVNEFFRNFIQKK